MDSKLSIPKQITVGFNKRNDTYTGKLAYVIYTDEKGVLRKEKSFNSWRDANIPTLSLDNKPISGFVLNKRVGGGNYGWHGRETKVRIYDPRDFEFEISVENLLFILQECSSIKGKGLEGEFVYSWSGSDIVLLPVSSQEYQSSIAFTDLKSKSVSKKDMQEGCIYQHKEMFDVMYLGRHYVLSSNGYGYKKCHENMYVFKTFGKADNSNTILDCSGYNHLEYESRTSKTDNYLFLKDLKKIADKKSDLSSDFPETYDSFRKSIYCAKNF